MSKPTVVLLHGVGLDHTMWEPSTALDDGLRATAQHFRERLETLRVDRSGATIAQPKARA